MLSLPASVHIYAATAPCDMRNYAQREVMQSWRAKCFASAVAPPRAFKSDSA